MMKWGDLDFRFNILLLLCTLFPPLGICDMLFDFINFSKFNDRKKVLLWVYSVGGFVFYFILFFIYFYNG